MYKLAHKDRGYLLRILDSIERIINYSRPFENADDFFEDTQAFDASMMNFVIIGEMVVKLSDEFIASTQHIVDWHRIKGFRNIIAHNYFGIDAEEVWQIIQTKLEPLDQHIQTFI